MQFGSGFLPTMALAACLCLPAAADTTPSADTVVARVNGEEITLGHVIVAHASLPEQYQQLPADVLYNGILDQLIQQSALLQSRKGDVPRHIELSLENERRSLLAADAIEAVMQDAASDSDVQAEYDSRYGDGVGGDEFNASHILVESEEEAKAIIAELEGGADFAAVAKEKSTGPSGPNGGELGWFGPGMMVPAFEAAVMELEPGAISPPVQTQFGWHVVKLNEKRKSKAPEFDAVRDQIAGELRDKAVEKRIEQLTREANIERPVVEGMKPELIKNLDLVRK